MSFTFYYVFKYWKKHKINFISLLISVALCCMTITIVLLTERTTESRHWNTLMDRSGNYQSVICNPTIEQQEKMTKLSPLFEIAPIAVCGKIQWDQYELPIGFYANEAARKMDHFPLLSGNFPQKIGEVAVPQAILNGAWGNVKIGDPISLYVIYANGNIQLEDFTLCGIMDNLAKRSDRGVDYGLISGWRGNKTENPNPCIFVSPDDTRFSPQYYNFLVHTPEYLRSLSVEDDKYVEYQNALNQLSDLDLIISNNILFHAAQSAFSSGNQAENNQLEYSKNKNDFVLRVLFVSMILVSLISLICSFSVFLKERLYSFRLLRCIGIRNSNLIQIVCIESAAFGILGYGFGIITALIFHEIILRLQQNTGMKMLHGYGVEWIVKQVTYSPWLVSAGGITVLLLLALCPFIFKLSKIKIVPTNALVRHYKVKHSFYKLFGDLRQECFAICSIVIVMASSVFSYLYYTGQGKGTTFLSIDQEYTEGTAYVQHGIDMLAEHIDVSLVGDPVQQGYGFGNSGIQSGITAKMEQKLGSLGKVYAWGFYAADVTLWYSSKPDFPLDDYYAPMDNRWNYADNFKNDAFYCVPVLLLNDMMMEELCGEPISGCILVANGEQPLFEKGTEIPLLSAIYDFSSNSVVFESMKRICVSLQDSKKFHATSNNPWQLLFSNILRKQTLVMTAEYAESIGLSAPCYTTAMISQMDLSNEHDILISLQSIIDKSVHATTLTSLEKKVKRNQFAANMTVIAFFVIFLIVFLIGFFNLLRMRIRQHLQNFSILHSIGVSYAYIRRNILCCALKTTLLAICFAAIFVFSFQTVEHRMYHKYYDLMVEQQELLGNPNFNGEDAWFEPSLTELDPEDKVYDITIQKEKIKVDWMLEREMWLPNSIPIFFILSIMMIAITMGVTYIGSHNLEVQIKKEMEKLS